MGPSFFKVFLPSHSSHHLSLPPAFVKNFEEEFPIEATLKDISGNLWRMEIEEDENGLSLKHGWQKFVTDHSLEYGDFLVFRYNGNSLFDVKVYGKNGCFKDQCLANKCMNKELKVSPTIVKLKHELNEGQSRPKSIRSCKWKSTGKGSSVSINSKGSCDTKERNSRGITLNHSEFVTTRNPHFVASILLRTAYNLEIPGKLLRENCLKLEPEMVFCTRDGKIWPVNVICRKDGRCAFGAGWKEFCSENSIKRHDKCRFEFVFQKNRTLSREILVTVVRART